MDDRTNVDLGIPLQVPYSDANLWFWKNTAVANLQPGQVATLGQDVVGYEVNEDLDNGFRPAGVMDMSSTTFTTSSRVVVPWGTVVGSGTGTHSLTLYRASNGRWSSGPGPIQWSWGLDGDHNDTTTTPDPSIQQATVNLLANMGAQPATLQAGLVPATASTDRTAPTSTITSPSARRELPQRHGGHDHGDGDRRRGRRGGRRGGFGRRRADVAPGHGRVELELHLGPQPARLGHDQEPSRGRQRQPGDPIGGSRGPQSGSISMWSSATIPGTTNDTDNADLEVGVKFTSDVAANILGVRFYKGPTNTGTHVGSLWTSAGTLLAQATFTNETTSGWQQVNFSSPVAINPNTVYVASYHTSVGHYASDDYYFLNRGLRTDRCTRRPTGWTASKAFTLSGPAAPSRRNPSSRPTIGSTSSTADQLGYDTADGADEPYGHRLARDRPAHLDRVDRQRRRDGLQRLSLDDLRVHAVQLEPDRLRHVDQLHRFGTGGRDVLLSGDRPRRRRQHQRPSNRPPPRSLPTRRRRRWR